MPPKRTNKFSEKARGSILGQLLDPVIGKEGDVLNAIEFIESPTGLCVSLYPMQRMLVRLLFAVPFDFNPEIPKWGEFPIWDEMRENKLHAFKTEAEALTYLYNEGQCNISDWRDMPKRGYKEAALFVGRRGGKSQVVSAIGCYALYRLLSIYSPKEYYDLISPEIDFTFLAQDADGSARLYRKIREDVNRSPWFSPYIRGPANTSEMTFVAAADHHKRDITPSIRVASFPCTTNATRGPSSIFLALDEFAHFRSEKDSSSEDIYNAATPATIQFTPKEGPDAGKRDAMVLSISSPWKRTGMMYEIHKQAMEEGKNSSVFTLRASSAEMNPRIDPVYLREELKKKPVKWRAEYGGQFLDSSESFVKKAQLDLVVEPERYNVMRFTPAAIGRQYFWGLDLGMKGDGTGLAIGHLEHRPQRGLELVYDYIDRMMIGEEFDGPGVDLSGMAEERKYVNYSELPLQDVLAWLRSMHEILPCFKGATDQYAGSHLVQLLKMNGIHNMDLLHLTAAINSQMFFALKGYIDNNSCRFPNVPKFITEIKQVEAELVNKYVLKVQAPLEKGAHDDMVDAAALVAYLAQKYLEEDGRMMLDPSGQSFAMQERLSKPPSPIGSIDAVPMRELQLMERMRRLNNYMGNMPTPVNPYGSRRKPR